MLGPVLWRRRPAIRSDATDVTDDVTRRSALVLAPHPDDETLGCGALIARKAAAGAAITVAIIADGRHCHRSATVSPAEIAQMRRAEVAEAIRRLGVPDGCLRQFGFEDLTLTDRESDLVELVANLLQEVTPDEVYATGAFEPHPDHAAVGRAARRAIVATGSSARLMEYPIWVWNQLWHGGPVRMRPRLAAAAEAALLMTRRMRPVKVAVGQFRDIKAKALDAHASQLRRPDHVPETEFWCTIPEALLAAAADDVELFVPWQPRKSSRAASGSLVNRAW